MTMCVPVRDMKNTADFTALVEQEGDVAVTKNGYSAFHCLSESEYRILHEESAKAKLLSRMMLAEEEAAAGRYADFDDFTQTMRAEYGL